MIGGLLSFNASELIVEIAFVSAFWQKKKHTVHLFFSDNRWSLSRAKEI